MQAVRLVLASRRMPSRQGRIYAKVMEASAPKSWATPLAGYDVKFCQLVQFAILVRIASSATFVVLASSKPRRKHGAQFFEMRTGVVVASGCSDLAVPFPVVVAKYLRLVKSRRPGLQQRGGPEHVTKVRMLRPV